MPKWLALLFYQVGLAVIKFKHSMADKIYDCKLFWSPKIFPPPSLFVFQSRLSVETHPCQTLIGVIHISKRNHEGEGHFLRLLVSKTLAYLSSNSMFSSNPKNRANYLRYRWLPYTSSHSLFYSESLRILILVIS